MRQGNGCCVSSSVTLIISADSFNAAVRGRESSLASPTSMSSRSLGGMTDKVFSPSCSAPAGTASD